MQLCGPLNDAQAILLQCGTYSVATADVAAVRAVRERSIRVDGRFAPDVRARLVKSGAFAKNLPGYDGAAVLAAQDRGPTFLRCD